MRHIPSRQLDDVDLDQSPQPRTRRVSNFLPPNGMSVCMPDVAHNESKQALQVVIVNHKRSVHVRFAKRQFGVQHQMPDSCLIPQANRHRCAGPVAVVACASFGHDDAQRSKRDETAQQFVECTLPNIGHLPDPHTLVVILRGRVTARTDGPTGRALGEPGKTGCARRSTRGMICDSARELPDFIETGLPIPKA
ncbi:hypothetical protein C1J02_08050 [Sulfitobacter sp. SK011]|nr:hypothetical protein C1J02_08050 [Sulfitobacter sp. SK011]